MQSVVNTQKSHIVSKCRYVDSSKKTIFNILYLGTLTLISSSELTKSPYLSINLWQVKWLFKNLQKFLGKISYNLYCKSFFPLGKNQGVTTYSIILTANQGSSISIVCLFRQIHRIFGVKTRYFPSIYRWINISNDTVPPYINDYYISRLVWGK